MIETQSIQEAHAMLTLPLSHALIGFPDGSVVKVLPAKAGHTGDLGLIRGWEDPLEEGSNPLQFSCLENPIDRGTWQAVIHRVTKSHTRLSDCAWACTHTLMITLLQDFLSSTLFCFPCSPLSHLAERIRPKSFKKNPCFHFNLSSAQLFFSDFFFF